MTTRARTLPPATPLYPPLRRRAGNAKALLVVGVVFCSAEAYHRSEDFTTVYLADLALLLLHLRERNETN
jgi:hypothetical protein